MFLLSVAMISLTLFLVWVTSIIKDCYIRVPVNESLNLEKIPSNSPFYDNDEDFCYKILTKAVSENSITTGRQPRLAGCSITSQLLDD